MLKRWLLCAILGMGLVAAGMPPLHAQPAGGGTAGSTMKMKGAKKGHKGGKKGHKGGKKGKKGAGGSKGTPPPK